MPRTVKRPHAAPLNWNVSTTKSKISSDIIESLRQSIASRAYQPGQRLPTEQTFASMFGVSQPTIREATRALEAMGLVEVRHGSGTFVRADLQDYVSTALGTLVRFERIGLLETLEIREVLGTYSARLAVQNATDADLEAVERFAEQCVVLARDPQSTPPQIAQSLIQFQRHLSLAAHHPLLTAVETYLITLLIRLQYVAKKEAGPEYWHRQSQEFGPDRNRIALLLRARKLDETVSAMRTYLQDQRRTFTSDAQLSSVRIDTPEASQVLSSAIWT